MCSFALSRVNMKLLIENTDKTGYASKMQVVM